MNATALITRLKIKGNLKTDAEVAELLGVSAANVALWQRGSGTITELQIANAILKSKAASVKKAHHQAIRPIVEFFPAECHWKSSDSTNAQVFSVDQTTLYKNGLLEILKSTKYGLYIFYDSSGKALYVGQTKNNIWVEMNSTYNRVRRGQELMLIGHPNRNLTFKRADEMNRQHRSTKLKLYDLACYFSVYEVEHGLVDNLEALLIRAFPNDLLNIKIQKITQSK